MRYLKVVLAVLMGLFGSSVASAQDYPTKNISLILPYPPGGGADAAARILAPKLSEILGKQVVVENRSGASSVLGTGEVARAAPDGHTILFADFSLAVTPSLVKELPYDTQRDLVPVIFVGRAPVVLVVNPAVPANNVQELIKLAKDKPGSLKYASPGSGVTYLAAVALLQNTKTEMVHVPYRGAGPALIDVIGGHVPWMFSIVGAVTQQIEQKQVRALAVSGSERTPILPGVPTFKESGVDLSVMEFGAWFGIMAPKGTPAPIVAKLNAAIDQALKDPATRDKFQAGGVAVLGGSVETFANFLDGQFKTWPGIVKAAGIEPQ